MRIPVIPDWCKGLPNSTMLLSCDIYEFFDYKNINGKSSGVAASIRDGYLPKPIALDFKMKGSRSKNKYQWTLGQIRELRVDMLKDDY